MPIWFGYWGGFCSIFPLFGLFMMGVMAFACMRGGVWMGRWAGRTQMDRSTGRVPDDVAELRREIRALREDVNKVVRNPLQKG